MTKADGRYQREWYLTAEMSINMLCNFGLIWNLLVFIDWPATQVAIHLFIKAFIYMILPRFYPLNIND